MLNGELANAFYEEAKVYSEPPPRFEVEDFRQRAALKFIKMGFSGGNIVVNQSEPRCHPVGPYCDDFGVRLFARVKRLTSA